MTAPPCRETKIALAGDRRDALLSALRRCSAVDAAEILAAPWIDWLADEDDDDWEDYVESELSTWVRTECRLHVDGGRFQHALALVERYCTLPQIFGPADAKARAARMDQ